MWMDVVFELFAASVSHKIILLLASLGSVVRVQCVFCIELDGIVANINS